MLHETQEIPAVIRRMVDDPSEFATIAEQLAASPPPMVLTIGRGSSAHAAEYFNRLLFSQLGIAALRAPISLLSASTSRFRADHCWGVAFSQSGKSPDLIRSLDFIGAHAERTFALVNTPDSPLAASADTSVLLPAGPEHSVAATKSFVAMITAAAQIVAFHIRFHFGQTDLLEALANLPDEIENSANFDWSPAIDVLIDADKATIIASGADLPVAAEAALKLQETAGIQTAAYTSAEARHGPMEIFGPGYPLLIFASAGPQQAQTLEFAAEMRTRGARVLIVASVEHVEADLFIGTTSKSLLEPFLMINNFYLLVEKLTRARGRDPDAPAYLKKVTET